MLEFRIVQLEENGISANHLGGLSRGSLFTFKLMQQLAQFNLYKLALEQSTELLEQNSSVQQNQHGDV